ncbi:MAG: PEGA domain-containing protein [Myxococcota bacterium]|nr:PEGA domain-containing protein [Myxococcota bacterium]
MRILIIVMVAALCSPAWADEREDRETARREFTAGQAADRQKKYQEAIEHYMRANDLVPHPFAMFNIAVDYERLGKLREAATWYERFLDSSTTRDSDRDKVNRTLIDLRNRPAQVQVLSNPDGARVIINGIPSGTTPYRGELKGGLYLVAIQKGDERDSKEITVEYGEPVKVEFALRNATTTVPATTTTVTPQEIRRQPPPRGASGVLFVRGDPYGALVHVDNVPIGTLPMTVPLEVGTHTIRVTADGHSPYEQQVNITSGSKTPVDVRLARALGTLTPTPTPGSALRIGYLAGGGAGADAKGSGALWIGEFGVRASKYDLSARIGQVDKLIFVDLIARWTITDSRFAPFIGGGYSFVSNGYGYVLCGGLRWDIADGEKAGISLMAESGYRFYSGASSDATTSAETIEGSIVPIMASLLVRYR